MRKLLLGSTAVAAAALFAPTGAMAQGVAFSDTSMGAAGTSMRGLEVRLGGYYRAMYNYTNQTGDSNATTRLGKSDFTNEIEIHILASGKAANGLQYGVAMEIENDAYRQPQAGNPATNVVSNSGKNTLAFDEAWAYLAGPGARSATATRTARSSSCSPATSPASASAASTRATSTSRRSAATSAPPSTP